VQLVVRNGGRVSRGPERENHHGRFTVIDATTSTRSRDFPIVRSAKSLAAARRTASLVAPVTSSSSVVTGRTGHASTPQRVLAPPQLWPVLVGPSRHARHRWPDPSSPTDRTAVSSVSFEPCRGEGAVIRFDPWVHCFKGALYRQPKIGGHKWETAVCDHVHRGTVRYVMVSLVVAAYTAIIECG